MKTIITIAVALCSIVSMARPLSQDEKLSDLMQLSFLIKSKYGPLELKQKNLKIDIDGLTAKYAERIKAASNLEFYYLINQFVAEFKDSHFSAKVPVKHLSTLGFIADRVEGKAILDQINRMMLPATKFPFQRGDEIVSIGGKSANEVAQQLGSYFGAGYQETDLRMATMLLGYRPSDTVPPQTGTVAVEMKSHTSGKVTKVDLMWQQLGDPIDPNELSWKLQTADGMDYLNLSIQDDISSLPNTERGYRCSGATRIMPPDDAEVIMEAPFVAYYHPTPKGNVGYLRIPHYMWINPQTGANEADLRFHQYEWVIQQLEKNTVALVIDQDHNCGGSVDFLEKMLTLFADKPFMGVQFQLLTNRNERENFKKFLSTEALHTLDGEGYAEVLDLMKSTAKKGDRLTPKISFHGSKLVSPNSVHYTKPILMLIDELSGSGGDAFPAMMQGMGRAKLFGTRTMGAGGHVVELEPLNNSGNMLRMTKSLFYHPNGTPIENNGASPDFNYQITWDDFMKGYQNYRKAYLEKVLSLVK